jgi:hypothetical protein
VISHILKLYLEKQIQLDIVQYNNVGVAYHALRESHIIRGLLGRGLVWAPGIPQYCELHSSLGTTFPKTTHLYPVRSNLLVGSNHKIVALSCGQHNVSVIG